MNGERKMKGANKIILNSSTMYDIIEHYFNVVMFKDFDGEVINVSENTVSKEFVITVTSKNE